MLFVVSYLSMELEIQKRDDGKYYRKVMRPDWEEVNEETIKENYYKASSEFDKNLKELEDLDKEVEKKTERNLEIEPILVSLKSIMQEEGWLEEELIE